MTRQLRPWRAAKCKPRIGEGVMRTRVPDAMQHEVLLRRAGTHRHWNERQDMGPGSAAHHAVKNGALRCVRGTKLYRSCHVGARLSMKAPMPSSASRAIMF